MNIHDCRILWDKRKGYRIPKRDKIAIKKDLKTMSKLIEEAMTYTKDKLLNENRVTAIQFWLNPQPKLPYYVKIWYERSWKGCEAWIINIEDSDNPPPYPAPVGGRSVGEVISEKYPLMKMTLDEYAEVEAI